MLVDNVTAQIGLYRHAAAAATWQPAAFATEYDMRAEIDHKHLKIYH